MYQSYQPTSNVIKGLDSLSIHRLQLRWLFVVVFMTNRVKIGRSMVQLVLSFSPWILPISLTNHRVNIVPWRGSSSKYTTFPPQTRIGGQTHTISPKRIFAKSSQSSMRHAIVNQKIVIPTNGFPHVTTASSPHT